jgi:Zn-dependent protease
MPASGIRQRLVRVSFNPLKRVEPVGTILLPGILLLMRSPFLLGYAKPVPVNFRALRSARCDMMLAAAAGPVLDHQRAGRVQSLSAPTSRRRTHFGLHHCGRSQ